MFTISKKTDLKTGLVQVTVREFDKIVEKHCQRNKMCKQKYHVIKDKRQDLDAHSLATGKNMIVINDLKLKNLAKYDNYAQSAQSVYDALVCSDVDIIIAAKPDNMYVKSSIENSDAASFFITGLKNLKTVNGSLKDNVGSLSSLPALENCKVLDLEKNQRIVSLPNLKSVDYLIASDSKLGALPELTNAKTCIYAANSNLEILPKLQNFPQIIDVRNTPLAGTRNGNVVCSKDAVMAPCPTMDYSGAYAPTNLIFLMDQNKISIGHETAEFKDFRLFAHCMSAARHKGNTYPRAKIADEFVDQVDDVLGLPHRSKWDKFKNSGLAIGIKAIAPIFAD